MDEQQRPDSQAPEEIPLGQRFFDSHFLLLVLGLLVMVVFFTAWGMVEIMTLPQSSLP